MTATHRPTRRAARRRALAAPVLVAAVVLTGCSAAEDAVGGAVDEAACSLARETLAGVEGQVREAADRIGADPRAARRELEALRDALAAAEDGLSGETRDRVAEARRAVDALVAEARRGARGAVDEEAVAEARRDLDTAVTGLQDVC